LLQPSGLDDAGGTACQAMLTGPAAGIGSLSGRTGLPEDSVRTAQHALTGLGLARASSGAPRRWEPASPQLGSAAIVRRQEAGLALRQQQITAAKTAAAVAAACASAYPTPCHTGWLADPELVHAQAQNLARSAVADLQVTDAAPHASGGRPAGRILDGPGLAAGIRLRALCHDSARDDPAAMAHIARLATPLTGALPPAEPASPSAGERALLRLLAGGLTDETAARRLGISVRTARRQMAALMGMLEASSRFQAGHKAAQRGWL